MSTEPATSPASASSTGAAAADRPAARTPAAATRTAGGTGGPPLRRFGELIPGETADAFAVVADTAMANTREGKPYVKLALRDRTRSASAFVWNNSPGFDSARRLRPGEVCKLRGRFLLDEKYGPKIELDNIRPLDPERDARDYVAGDLYRTTRYDVPRMWTELNAILAEHIRDEGVRLVTAEVLRRVEDAFKAAPAAAMNHHAWVGGLLEHTLSVVRLCVHLADKYADMYRDTGVVVDKDLVVAGGALHDVGKVVELDIRPGVGSYTTPGLLVGHIQIGRDMLRDAAKTLGRPAEDKLLLLEHIILSHQGKKEWSSPVEPRCIEALLVHMADDTDAKTNMFVEAVLNDPGDDGFTGRKNIFGRELYRGM